MDCDPLQGTAVSFTADCIQVAMADGSVLIFKKGISREFWLAAHTPGAGGVTDWDPELPYIERPGGKRFGG